MPAAENGESMNVLNISSLGRQDIACVAILLVVSSLLYYVAWLGFAGSDDAYYAAAAQNWLNDFPYVGDNHWSLRHPLVLPLAASFAVFGLSEFALFVPIIIYNFLVVLLGYFILRNRFSGLTSTLLSVILVSTPLFAASGGVCFIDIAELLFVALSLTFFAEAVSRDFQVQPLVIAGAFAGLAFSSRETAAALIVFYGLCFLLGYGGHRLKYFVMAGGFLIVFAIEALYYLVMTGNPLHRLNISLHHDEITRSEEAQKIIDGSGSISTDTVFDTLLLVLLNQEFGILYYVFFIAVFWVFLSRNIAGVERIVLRVLSGSALTWLLCLALAGGILFLLPRYTFPSTFAAALVVAIVIGSLWQARRHLLAAGLGIAIVAVNLLCISVENRAIFHGERQLVALAGESNETIHTDGLTLHRIRFLLQVEGLDNVSDLTEPADGALWYRVPRNINQTIRDGGEIPLGERLRTDPGYSFETVAIYDPGRRWLGPLIEAIGLRDALPTRIYAKIDRPNQSSTLYRIRRK